MGLDSGPIGGNSYQHKTSPFLTVHGADRDTWNHADNWKNPSLFQLLRRTPVAMAFLQQRTSTNDGHVTNK